MDPENSHKVYTLPGRKFNPIDNRLLKIIHENLVSICYNFIPVIRSISQEHDFCNIVFLVG